MACATLLAVSAFVVVGVAASARTSLAHAEVYKCTESSGRVLYSDVPCKGGAVVDERTVDLYGSVQGGPGWDRTSDQTIMSRLL